MKYLFVAILAVIALAYVSAQEPAMAVGITAAGVKTIANGILPVVMDAVRTGEFDGESGTESGYKYSVSRIRVTRLNYQDLTMERAPDGVSIRAGITRLTVAVNLHWSYKKKKFPYLPQGSGSADAAMEGCTIHGNFRLQRQTVNGRPGLLVRVSDPAVHLDNVSIKTHGSLFSWLYNIIIRIFRNKITRTLQDAIRESFAAAVNARAAQVLATMELIKPVSSWGVIDLSLPRDPIAYNNAAGPGWSLAFNGEVYPATTRQPLNVVPRVAMPWTTVNRHFELNFNFFTINSAGAVWKQVRNWASTVSNTIPPPAGFPVALTAPAWQSHVPQVQTTYPGSGLEIKTTLENFPRAATNGQEMVMSVSYLMAVTAQGRPVFTIRAACSGAAVIMTRGNAIVPRINDMTTTFTVVSSSIGNFNLKAAEFIFNAVVKLIALPAINNELFAGFPLPTVAGLNFINPQFSVRQGFIAAGFDVAYQP